MQVATALKCVPAKQGAMVTVKQAEMPFGVARKGNYLEIPGRTQADAFSSAKGDVHWLNLSKIAPDIPGYFLGIKNAECPVSIVTATKEHVRIIDGFTVRISATEQFTRCPTLNASISTHLIGIRVGVDYKSQVNRFNPEFS